jgi:1,4-alpha-glucan branching enzyme
MEGNRLITETEIYLFNQGTNYRCYNFLGAHQGRKNGISGMYFSVWAPMVRGVSVIGSFNSWQGGKNPMTPVQNSGIWTTFVPNLQAGELYKYLIETEAGDLLYKADPFAFSAEPRPGTASMTARLSGFRWHDAGWLKKRAETSHFTRPMNIYEVHLGSWKRRRARQPGEAEEALELLYTYRELADILVPYVKEMGYTHIELLPVMEHPFDGSWGYQVTGYYAPTSRYGSPHDLMYFIDVCHCSGLGVILDWVPGHFCRDAQGLGRFNSNKLYEIADHEQWGTYKFDFGRLQVRSFLISNALFWLDKYHIDGLRVDGVTSMLYLSFTGEKDGTGSEVNGEAIAFLRAFNTAVGSYYPGVFTVAEESSAWPLVTQPPSAGGLGFHYKWDMGWMNDTLRYMSLDFDLRSMNHRLLTFSSMYAHSENFINPLSHDEVVHGKRSLIGRMPGDYWRQFAGLRLLALYQICHTGAKLSFMGNEIGQFIEWRYYEELEWFLLAYEAHRQYHNYIKALNKLYVQQPAFWEGGYDKRSFSWLDADNEKQSIFVFIRQAKREDIFIVAVLNFQPISYDTFRIGVPFPGSYMEIFNSDDKSYGGSGCINGQPISTEDEAYHGQKQSIVIKVPPLGGTLYLYNGGAESTIL